MENIMYKFLLFSFIIVSIGLILLIMIQYDPKGLGLTFNSNVSNSLFRSVSSSSFIKITSLLAALFFIISLVLGNIHNNLSKVNKNTFICNSNLRIKSND